MKRSLFVHSFIVTLLLIVLFIGVIGCGSSGGGSSPGGGGLVGGKYFVYAVNAGSNNISTYSLNTATGVLTPVGAAVNAGNNPQYAAATPDGRFLYVVNNGDNSISIFSINKSSGALTQITSGSPVNMGDGAAPKSAVVSKNGKFLYVGTYSSCKIYCYEINTNTGQLTALSPAFYNVTGGYPAHVVIDPSGSFLYATGYDCDSQITAYQMNSTTGALNQIGLYQGYFPYYLAIMPTGGFLYATDTENEALWIYSINPSTGVLTDLGNPNSPMLVGAGPSYLMPLKLAFSIDSKYLYVASYEDSVIAYSANTGTGVLTRIATYARSAGSMPYDIKVEPNSKFCYVANYGTNNISAFTINQETGELTELVSGSPVSAGTNPMALAIVKTPQ